jgi:hypothetical protein
MAKATVDGLKRLRRPEDVAKARGKTVMEVLPLPRVSAPAEASAGDEQATDVEPSASDAGSSGDSAEVTPS